MSDVTYSSAENIARVLIVPHAVFSVLATVLVGMRLYVTRVVAKSPWTFDEHVAIVALVREPMFQSTRSVESLLSLMDEIYRLPITLC